MMRLDVEGKPMQPADILGLMVPVTYFVFLFTEKLWSARQFPPRKGWQFLGIAFLLIVYTLGVVTPLLLPLDWLPGPIRDQCTAPGVVGGTIVWFVLLL